MRIPATRERVGVEGHSGTFLVVWVDQERNTVDLIPLVEGDIVMSVPFSQVRPLRDVQEDSVGL